jgi:hypothetical protein
VKKKIWKLRLLLESKLYSLNGFITLTYDNDHIPPGASLQPEDLRLFLHRFRKRIQRSGLPKIRYFAIGEYGTQTERPHYHLIVYNYGCLSKTRYVSGSHCNCVYCDILRKSWSSGHVALGTVESDSIDYVCDHNLKTVVVDGKAIMGLTDLNDPFVVKWLKGRHPEFRRMSNRPGIGGLALEQLCQNYFTRDFARFLSTTGDVPSQFVVGGRVIPIGRYIREGLRKMYGFPMRRTPKGSVTYAPKDSMLKLSAQAIADFEKVKEVTPIGKDAFRYARQLRERKCKSTEVIYSRSKDAKSI